MRPIASAACATSSSVGLTNTPTSSTRRRSARAIAGRDGRRRSARGEPGQRIKPIAQAPSSTASSASSRRVMPQILTARHAERTPAVARSRRRAGAARVGRLERVGGRCPAAPSAGAPAVAAGSSTRDLVARLVACDRRERRSSIGVDGRAVDLVITSPPSATVAPSTGPACRRPGCRPSPPGCRSTAARARPARPARRGRRALVDRDAGMPRKRALDRRPCFELGQRPAWRCRPAPRSRCRRCRRRSPPVAICELMPITRPVGVEQRAAGVAGVDRRVGLDDVVDREAAGGLDAALQRRDDAGGERAVEPERVADRHRRVADPDRRRVAERRAA